MTFAKRIPQGNGLTVKAIGHPATPEYEQHVTLNGKYLGRVDYVPVWGYRAYRADQDTGRLVKTIDEAVLHLTQCTAPQSNP